MTLLPVTVRSPRPSHEWGYPQHSADPLVRSAQWCPAPTTTCTNGPATQPPRYPQQSATPVLVSAQFVMAMPSASSTYVPDGAVLTGGDASRWPQHSITPSERSAQVVDALAFTW